MQGKKLKKKKDNSQNKIFITSIYFKLFIKNLESEGGTKATSISED